MHLGSYLVPAAVCLCTWLRSRAAVLYILCLTSCSLRCVRVRGSVALRLCCLLCVLSRSFFRLSVFVVTLQGVCPLCIASYMFP